MREPCRPYARPTVRRLWWRSLLLRVTNDFLWNARSDAVVHRADWEAAGWIYPPEPVLDVSDPAGPEAEPAWQDGPVIVRPGPVSREFIDGLRSAGARAGLVEALERDLRAIDSG